jgi:hypothetical protein
MSRVKYDNKGFKFLRVKNWEKYQPDARLRNKDARLPWVKDWTNKLENYEFTQLTFYQRHLFEAICLLVATRPSRTIHNDPTHISRATHAQATDIPHVGHALSTLILQGFIIPTNTEKFIDEDDENVARDREGEGEREGEGDCQSVSQLVSYEEAEEQKESDEFKVIDKEILVHDLPCFTLLHEEFGRAEKLPEEVVRRVHSALKALGKTPAWMQGCLQFALNHKFWAGRVVNAGAFAKVLINGINDPEGKKLPAQYDRYVAQKRRAAGAGNK